jgi:preprotein translocase subunit SecD
MIKYFYFAVALISITQGSSQTVIIDKKNITDSIIKTGWYYIIDADSGYKRQIDKKTEFLFIGPTPIITANNFTEVNILEIQESENHNIFLTFTLDKDGQYKWTDATGKAVGKRIAFILDNQLLDVHLILGQENRTWIQTIWDNNKYSRKELEQYKTIIETEMNGLNKN